MVLPLDQLSESQRAAAMWNDGPALVLASPGAGKTHVLALRIARLIDESPRKHFRILGLTFTNKAADEMRSRIDGWVEKGRERAVLRTFHGFCADLLAQHGSHLGLTPEFKILEHDEDRAEVLLEAIDELRTRSPEVAAGHSVSAEDTVMLPRVEKLLADPSVDLDARAQDRDEERVRVLAVAYLKRQRELNRLDFPALLRLALELLRTQPAVADLVRTIYRYVCVDEFQDTNAAQYAILRYVVSHDTPNLFCVGDEDQVIYAWNGASPFRIRQLATDYPGLVRFYLPESWRCPHAIVDLANRLIERSASRDASKPPIQAVGQADSGAVLVLDPEKLDDEGAEASAIVADIRSQSPAARQSCAVLARTQKLIERVHQELQVAGIPARMLRRSSAYTNAALAWSTAVLELAAARGDARALRRCSRAWLALTDELAYPPSPIQLSDVQADALRDGGDLLAAWFRSMTARVPADMEVVWKQLHDDLLVQGTWANFVDVTLSEFDAMHDALDEADPRRQDYELERSHFKEAKRDAKGKTLAEFMREFSLKSKVPDPLPGHVTCATISASKGAEWDRVYLAGLADEILPSFHAVKPGAPKQQLEEERRLCFVAITRTRRTLILSWAKSYHGYAKRRSRFVDDMLGKAD